MTMREPPKERKEVQQNFPIAGISERKLAALEAWKKSLLHQTFSGGL